MLQKPEPYLASSSALGFAHHKLGDFDAARAAFEAIVAADPQRYKAHYGLGLVALSEGRLDAARPALEEALRQVDQAFVGTIHSFCSRILRERPLEAWKNADGSERRAFFKLKQRIYHLFDLVNVTQ